MGECRLIAFAFTLLQFIIMLRFPNPNNNEWLNKYNDLVESVECGKVNFSGGKSIEEGRLTLHHIIPRSLAPELSGDTNNHIWLPFKEHMDLHYYLWKANPDYGIQLWFGCVFGRKHGYWNLPTEAEYNQLKKDVARYRREHRKKKILTSIEE
jgi:hypothetical protein